jgi:hypothetical protein
MIDPNIRVNALIDLVQTALIIYLWFKIKSK